MVLAASSLTDNLETAKQESVQCVEDARHTRQAATISSICADIPRPELDLSYRTKQLMEVTRLILYNSLHMTPVKDCQNKNTLF